MTKCAVAVVVVAAMVSCSPTTPKIVFKHGEIRGRLQKNGLRFVVMPDATTSLAEVDVRYEVGSREDPPGKAGLAHLAEHLMFQQRPEGPSSKPMMQRLQQLTLNFNAYTNWDSTHYMLSARAEVVDELIKAEAVRMFYGCETISEEEFEREREVVRNEIRGGNRAPEALIPQLTLAAVYPKGHAYAQMVGGDDVQISTITLRDACDFLHKYYVPERATVIVAGGIAPDATVRAIEKWFAAVEKRAPAARRVVEPLAMSSERKTIELDLERPWLTVAWPLPDARTPAGEAAQLGIWGAFADASYRADEYDCSTNGFAEVYGGREAPVFMIGLELTGMAKLDTCLSFVWKAAHNAARGWDGGMWQQLEELKNRRKAALISSLEPLFGHRGRTDHVGDLVQFSRDFDFDSRGVYVFHELDKIGRFEIAQVGAAVHEALAEDRAHVTVFAPSKTGIKGDRRSAVVFQARTEDDVQPPELEPGEAQRPLAAPSQLNVFAGATRFELDNGLRVVLLPVDAMPVVAAQLVFDAGDAATPGSPALAHAAAQLLALPPGSTALGETGVRLQCGSTPDHLVCGAHGMSIYLDVVIRALERTIKIGWYSQLGVERWQKARHALYKLRRSRQELEFERQQLAAIFGPEHPYTTTGAADPRSIDGVGRDALSTFRDDHYIAANATLVVAGMFDPRRAEAVIRDSFGDWSVGHKAEPLAAAAYHRTGPIHVGVIGDDDPQVDVAILYPSPAGISGEQAARLVLTEMLREQMWTVRSKLGATYGTHARRDARLGGSTYDLGGAIDAPRAGEAIRAMRDGIDALRRGSDFDALFVRARRKVVQDLVGGSTQSRELANQLGLIARFGLDPSYQTALLRQTAALSIAQVKTILARELAPESEVIVALGDRAAVARAFADAGISDARLVEPSY